MTRHLQRSGPLPRLRQVVQIRGVVQGVGFRPAVHRLAQTLGLGGFIRNVTDGVLIEIEGSPEAVPQFLPALARELPAPARIEWAQARSIPPTGETTFRIEESRAGGAAAPVLPPDLAPCDECLRELADPRNRRYRYPFINCTACGPRFTIVRALPYDRARTTMEPFVLCAACRREYEDPIDRRFHAEPNGCPVCGPRLSLLARGKTVMGDAALEESVQLLSAGAILAVKGAGGFLLACDAGDERAVERLRTRKQRPDKPFAVLVRSLDDARRLAQLDLAAERALTSVARPIVLVPARPDHGLARSLNPRLVELGLFLPPTPLQHLLVTLGPHALVMTSGNRSDEPLARDNAEARTQLVGIADGFLMHDREIHTRADDSVVRVIGGRAVPLRRARGFVPAAIALPIIGPAVLAVGGALKSTVCLAANGQAVLSQHLGDLDDPTTFRFFEESIAKLTALLGAVPRAVAHDLHPDYPSTRWARRAGLPGHAVQHHHAHLAACLAEHGREDRVLGVAFDGTGCGLDGNLWGGEILELDLGDFRRLGHLSPLRLPGGEAAIRAPWRQAVSALIAAGEPLEVLREVDAARLRRVRELLHVGVACPSATGAGRWFDTVAALCGIGHQISYEGQAAIELEAAAAPGDPPPFAFALHDHGDADDPFVIDLLPMVRELARELRHAVAVPLLAARFHETLAQAITAACQRARAAGSPSTVALSGGCFQNRRLTERAAKLLGQAGFEVLLHRKVPPGDGGLALGQAAVVTHRLAAAERRSKGRSDSCA